MKILLAIGSGSFIGGVLRYLISLYVQNRFLSAYPFGTLTVNVIGCLFIGFVYGLSDKGGLSQEWRLFLATGIAGGFTTFSSFSNETVSMLRDGELFHVSTYLISSIVLGVLATMFGIFLSKLF